MKKTRLLGVVYACICVLFFPTIAKAATVLDFGIKAPTTGTLSYAGGAAPLVGSDIDVDDVVGLNTSLNNNVLSICASCTLDLQTGASTGGSTGGWNYGAGGTITITGGIDFPDATPDIATGTTLLQGTFNSATVIDLGSGTFEFQILGGSFTDTKHPELLAFYGLPDIGYVGGLNISFSTTANMGDFFTSDQIFSGNVTNQPVPLPAAAWLFASGLLGLIGIARKKAA
jgi:hypothetical protein